MDQPLADAFQFCPRCGHAADVTGVNPLRCPGCGFTLYFGPTVAVAGIVADHQGQILLIRRARDPGRGKFGLPGGFVDVGERVETALAREVREEVNLEVERMTFLASFPNSYAYSGVLIPVADLFFACQVESFDSIKAQQGEVDGWHFCHPTTAELDQMAFESNRKALERYLAIASDS